MTEADYQGQVVEYLSTADRERYRDRFAEMQDRVFTLLSEENGGTS